MKIGIMYEFCTDGDFSLRTPEKFGITTQDDEYYAGDVTFENENAFRAKEEARSFLEKLLCDGLHILYTHYYILDHFYHAIDNLIEFISKNYEGYSIEQLSGNYDGTRIGVVFYLEKEEQPDVKS